jgi:hypothetical protein
MCRLMGIADQTGFRCATLTQHLFLNAMARFVSSVVNITLDIQPRSVSNLLSYWLINFSLKHRNQFLVGAISSLLDKKLVTAI